MYVKRTKSAFVKSPCGKGLYFVPAGSIRHIVNSDLIYKQTDGDHGEPTERYPCRMVLHIDWVDACAWDKSLGGVIEQVAQVDHLEIYCAGDEFAM